MHSTMTLGRLGSAYWFLFKLFINPSVTLRNYFVVLIVCTGCPFELHVIFSVVYCNEM